MIAKFSVVPWSLAADELDRRLCLVRDRGLIPGRVATEHLRCSSLLSAATWFSRLVSLTTCFFRSANSILTAEVLLSTLETCGMVSPFSSHCYFDQRLACVHCRHDEMQHLGNIVLRNSSETVPPANALICRRNFYGERFPICSFSRSYWIFWCCEKLT